MRWAAQADGACRPWQEQIDAVPPPTDAAGLSRWVSGVLPPLRGQIAALAKLKPPTNAEEARRATLFVDSLRALQQALTRYSAALRANDADAVTAALAQANAAGAQARSYSVSVGVTRCGGYEG